MAEYLLVRHAEPLKDGFGPFGEVGPPLSEVGILQAEQTGRDLRDRGIDVDLAEAAVSLLLRAEQTATYAGFGQFETVPFLAEVNTGNPAETARLIESNRVPALALKIADQILGRLPEQRVWFTHGLVIMALRERLGMKVELARFVPSMVKSCHWNSKPLGSCMRTQAKTQQTAC